MAFLPSTFTPTRSLRRKQADPRGCSRSRSIPTRTSCPNHSNPIVAQARSNVKPHKKAPANVIDSRVASRVEAHHWVIVKDHSMRIFERAAVAQADAVRQIEARNGNGALHRWVLRQVADPTQPSLAVQDRDGRYVVMEAFPASGAIEANPNMRRWLSAVERVGPLMNTVDIRTLRYENLFTTKRHNAKFDPNTNIVVVESVNVDISKQGNVKQAVSILKSVAEKNVASGDCLEFCVLHAPREVGFFKTIEIYKDIDALRKHMNGLDIAHSKKLEDCLITSQRNRQTFKPIVFS